jgi:hypothetical protein
MRGTPAIYCSTCHVLREIRQWHGDDESFLIELDPCGHVVRRNARVEWMVHSTAA